MAGATAERQENGLVGAITKAVKENMNNPITLVAGKVTIEGVTSAHKYSGRQITGSEPYTDVVIVTIKEEINLSCKGPAAPSLAGGGLRGLELAAPSITRKFMTEAFNSLIKKLKPGDKVPDVFGEISSTVKTKIVIGNEAMGGPIHYMYIGPMDVNQNGYNKANNILKLNGALHEAKSYAKSHKLYFRLRARREDQRFDPTAKEKDGTPKIYGKSPSRGDSAGRIVVTDKVSSNGIKIRV